MPIYQSKGYITKEEAAKIWQVQVRTINDWIRKTNPAPENFSWVDIDGYVCVKHPIPMPPLPPNIPLESLEWVRNFANRNSLFFGRVYDAIIQGKISGVAIADRVFVIKTEPELLNFVANYKRKK